MCDYWRFLLFNAFSLFAPVGDIPAPRIFSSRGVGGNSPVGAYAISEFALCIFGFRPHRLYFSGRNGSRTPPTHRISFPALTGLIVSRPNLIFSGRRYRRRRIWMFRFRNVPARLFVCLSFRRGGNSRARDLIPPPLLASDGTFRGA